MRSLRSVVAIIGVGALGSGCAVDAVVRHFDLAPEARVPTGSSTVVGAYLRVRIENVEELASGKSFVAWASAGSVWVRLGDVEPGATVTFDSAALSLEWADVEWLRVLPTGEETAPVSSADEAYFEGLPGEELWFGGASGPNAETLAEATATAEIVDSTLWLSYTHLPPLGNGASYCVWLVASHEELDPAAGGHDEHSEHEGHGDSEGPESPLYVGELGSSGQDTMTITADLAGYRAAAVTIELDSGVESAAVASLVMRGEIPQAAVPATGSSEPAESEAHIH